MQSRGRLEAALLAAQAAPASLGTLGLFEGRTAAAVVLAVVAAAVVIVAAELIGRSGRGSAWATTSGVEVPPRTGRARTVFRDIEAQWAPSDLASVKLLNRQFGVVFF